MTREPESQERWEVRWNPWMGQWEVFYPKGRASAEGTQAYESIATTRTRLHADHIVALHNEWVKREPGE